MPLEVNEAKALKAFKALYKHEQPIAEKEEAVWLMVSTFNKISLNKGRPTRIVLKHGCQMPGVHRCLIVEKNQQKVKDMIKEKKIKGVHKVLDIKHLKKLYPTPDSKRKLIEEFEMLMAQKTIITDLYQVLGKEVYKKRREPIPIDIYKQDFQKEVLRTAKSTYMNFHTGTCYAIKIATIDQTDKIAFDNFMGAYRKIIDTIPGGEDNIRSFQIKTSNSTSLPLYEAETDYVDIDHESDQEQEEFSN